MPRLMNSPDLPQTYEELVVMYLPAPIHNETAYRKTMRIFDELMRLPSPSDDQVKFIELLSVLLDSYERQAHLMPEVDSVAVLKHLMAEQEWTASDLGRELGDRSLGSRLLRGERKLSKAHIRTLSERFGVDPSLLLAE